VSDLKSRNESVRQASAIQRGSLMGHRVLAELGRKDLVTTYLVTDPVDGTLQTLKHIERHTAEDDERCRRLATEYEIGRRLEHVCIRRVRRLRRERRGFRVREVGLFQQYVDGPTLDRWDVSHTDVILGVMEQVGEALSHVHEQGLVHGAIRPRHILVADTGAPSLIGFAETAEAGIAFPGGQGSPGYSSPEQFLGGIRTARADVFGFAATIAAVILRARLQMGNASELNAADWLDLHQEWVESLRQGCGSDGLNRLLEQCLHPDPTRRPVGIDEVVVRLRALRSRGDQGKGEEILRRAA
jgi:serine/threonine protein kinase